MLNTGEDERTGVANGAGAGTRTGVAAGTGAGTEERVAGAVTNAFDFNARHWHKCFYCNANRMCFSFSGFFFF